MSSSTLTGRKPTETQIDPLPTPFLTMKDLLNNMWLLQHEIVNRSSWEMAPQSAACSVMNGLRGAPQGRGGGRY